MLTTGLPSGCCRLENTLPGRDGYEVEIFGMEGFPADVLKEYRTRKEEEAGILPGSAGEPAVKKPKISYAAIPEADLLRQLAIHKAVMLGLPPPSALPPPPMPGFGPPPQGGFGGGGFPGGPGGFQGGPGGFQGGPGGFQGGGGGYPPMGMGGGFPGATPPPPPTFRPQGGFNGMPPPPPGMGMPPPPGMGMVRLPQLPFRPFIELLTSRAVSPPAANASRRLPSSARLPCPSARLAARHAHPRHADPAAGHVPQPTAADAAPFPLAFGRSALAWPAGTLGIAARSNRNACALSCCWPEGKTARVGDATLSSCALELRLEAELGMYVRADLIETSYVQAGRLGWAGRRNASAHLPSRRRPSPSPSPSHPSPLSLSTRHNSLKPCAHDGRRYGRNDGLWRLWQEERAEEVDGDRGEPRADQEGAAGASRHALPVCQSQAAPVAANVVSCV